METHTRQEQDAVLETYRSALGLGVMISWQSLAIAALTVAGIACCGIGAISIVAGGMSDNYGAARKAERGGCIRRRGRPRPSRSGLPGEAVMTAASRGARLLVLRAAVAAGGAGAALTSHILHCDDDELAAAADECLELLLQARSRDRRRRRPARARTSAADCAWRSPIMSSARSRKRAAAGSAAAPSSAPASAFRSAKGVFGNCSWADSGRTLCTNPVCLEKAGVARAGARVMITLGQQKVLAFVREHGRGERPRPRWREIGHAFRLHADRRVEAHPGADRRRELGALRWAAASRSRAAWS
jgi:hypothetical protein